MATDTARINLELASGRNELTALSNTPPNVNV